MTKTSSLTHWRNYANNYRLCAKKCVACDKIYFPKKRLCLCGGQEFEDVQLSGRGKLLTFTQVINPTREFVGTTPYCLGIIEVVAVFAFPFKGLSFGNFKAFHIYAAPF